MQLIIMPCTYRTGIILYKIIVSIPLFRFQRNIKINLVHSHLNWLHAAFGDDCTEETELTIEEAHQHETKRSLFDFSTSLGVCIITLLDRRRDCEL